MTSIESDNLEEHMNNTQRGYKVLTHDYRSPIQGGEPIWDGSLPYTLPGVSLDTSGAECAAGWNYCEDIATALSIGGLWPDGWPSVVVEVEPGASDIARGNKRRASSLTILRLCSEAEVAAAVGRLSERWFASEHIPQMVDEQIAWRRALGRPGWDRGQVIQGMEEALRARGLPWQLKEHRAARPAWDARAAWYARAARDAWAAWSARDAWAAWDAWDAWDGAARAVRAAWGARAARDARDAWAAGDARDALITMYCSLQGWIDAQPDLLTRGLRDAYEHGLAFVLPTGPAQLGWVMRKRRP